MRLGSKPLITSPAFVEGFVLFAKKSIGNYDTNRQKTILNLWESIKKFQTNVKNKNKKCLCVQTSIVVPSKTKDDFYTTAYTDKRKQIIKLINLHIIIDYTQTLF